MSACGGGAGKDAGSSSPKDASSRDAASGDHDAASGGKKDASAQEKDASSLDAASAADAASADKDASGSIDASSADGGAGCAAGGTPTVLAKGQDHPTKIVSDGKNVYWITHPDDATKHSVMKVAVGGGTPKALASKLRDPDYLAVDDSGVYWVDASPDFPNAPQILSVPLKGGKPAVVVAGGVSKQQFAIAAGKIYYFEGAMLHTVATSGGSATTTMPASENAFNATADASNLYWIDDHQHVLKLAFGDSTAKVLTTLVAPADFLGLSQPISVDKTGIYAPFSPSPNMHAVMKLALEGGKPTTLATFQTAGNGVPGIVSDGTNVYWANNANFVVQRAPVAGGSAVTISCDNLRPSGIAQDANNVYWTTDNGADGSVMKLAK